jgi:hypothetical protein
MVGAVLVLGQDYDIAMRCARVDSILFPTDIVRGIVDTKNVVRIQAVMLE